jgi:hypothetical protein
MLAIVQGSLDLTRVDRANVQGLVLATCLNASHRALRIIFRCSGGRSANRLPISGGEELFSTHVIGKFENLRLVHHFIIVLLRCGHHDLKLFGRAELRTVLVRWGFAQALDTGTLLVENLTVLGSCRGRWPIAIRTHISAPWVVTP